MKHPLKSLEVNNAGRTFIVGDIHGSLSCFNNLIENIKFDETVDRMISVGDLVDRGPHSFECLQLLYKPWFHATFANHEKMMLNAFENSNNSHMWLYNGGEWGYEQFNDWKHRDDKARIPMDRSVELFELIELVKELPYVITVKNKVGKKFHVLHAELPAGGVEVTDELMEDPDKLHKLVTIQRGEGDAVLWSRSVFGALYDTNLQNKDKLVRAVAYNNRKMVFNDKLSHIISGHTIVQHPITVVGQTCIDTGAFDSYWKIVQPYQGGNTAPVKWAGLTCVDIDTWKFYKATTSTFTEVEPIVITQKEIDDARH